MLSEEKIKHNVEVARLCYEISKEKYGCTEKFARAMWVIGYNHDIGYEFMDKTEKPSIHPDISDDILFTAFHGSNYAIKWHGKKIAQDDLSLRILNEADLKVNSKGKRVSVKDRLKDIENRYGKNSSQYLQALWLAEELNLINID